MGFQCQARTPAIAEYQRELRLLQSEDWSILANRSEPQCVRFILRGTEGAYAQQLYRRQVQRTSESGKTVRLRVGLYIPQPLVYGGSQPLLYGLHRSVDTERQRKRNWRTAGGKCERQLPHGYGDYGRRAIDRPASLGHQRHMEQKPHQELCRLFVRHEHYGRRGPGRYVDSDCFRSRNHTDCFLSLVHGQQSAVIQLQRNGGFFAVAICEPPISGQLRSKGELARPVFRSPPQHCLPL